MITRLAEKVMSVIIGRILPTLLTRISKEVKETVANFLDELETKAIATDNPFDDFLVDVLKVIFNVD